MGRVSHIIELFVGFLTWWLDELVNLVPERFLPEPDIIDNYLSISATNDEYSFAHHTADNITYIATCPHNPKSLRQALTDIRSADRILNKLPVRFEVSSPRYMMWSKKRPLAAARRLHDLARIDALASTPLAGEDVDVLIEIVSRDSSQIETRDYVIKRTFLEQIKKMFVGLDIPSLQIVPDGTGLDFLNSSAGHNHSWVAGARRWTALALAVGLVVLAGIWTRQGHIIAGLETTTEAAQNRILAIRSAESDSLERRYTAYEALTKRRANYSSVVENWDVLSNLLPDQAWLSELRIEDDTIRLVGFAKEAAPLVRTLEAHPQFSSVRLTAPISLDSRREAERFSLELITLVRASSGRSTR